MSAFSPSQQAVADSFSPSLLLLAASLLAAAMLAAFVFTIGMVGRAGVYGSAGVLPSALEEQLDIPAKYLSLYLRAASRYGLDWSILAAVGKVECDHGRDSDPSCSREGAVNAAGAGGPAQFLAQTWRQYGVDGNGDGVADRWNAADAIFGMANYLRASGAPGDYAKALFAYNHVRWYVARVLQWTAIYRAAADGSGATFADPERARGAVGTLSLAGVTPVRLVAGERAVLSPLNGHLALIPAQAPATVQAMVMAANELQELPYGPDGHPDPRGASSEDCSSTINYVLYRSGVRPIGEILRANPLAQDYLSWGLPGPGRWVTIYATARPTDHVFIVIAGLRLDTSHDGTDTGPNRHEDGPRWRVFGRIPAWAHWSVRHPPGL